ncbi:beta-glucosidase, putative [Ricinus communis]|uniref:Beta-glucosidase, putative n=1 Tax=Ricinus communis TaxID=3988 RepID=B9RAJ3_RICCO|nr:beta-glucosidase, putative [Ricinus communis]
MALSSPNSVSLNLLQIAAFSLLSCFYALEHGIPVKVEPQIALRAEDEEHTVKRSDFSNDFLFGASTAALQIEGSTKSEGRRPSIWDTFLEKHQAKVIDGSNVNTAIDSYKRYREDLEHLKNLGVNAYRFSISWTRIFPGGSLSGGVNQQGIDHYNKLINILMEYGIKPLVTLYHFDLPQALEEKYGGFLNSSILNDFKDYCDICFETFGDRVKTWITINEPLMIAQLGYDIGIAPPGRCSKRADCAAGNSSTEPYIVTHNLLLSHAAAAKLYKEKYQAKQGGEIGISLVGKYFEPFSESVDDKTAQERALDFELGWYIEPLVYGDYPSVMRELVKDRLPTFTKQERKLVKDSFDFIGINYYTSNYAKSIPIDPNAAPTSYTYDQFVDATGYTDIYVYPEGLQKVLEFIKQKYQNPKIYITENGVTEKRDDSRGLIEALDDQHRISYIQQHLYRVHKAIKTSLAYTWQEWGECKRIFLLEPI